MPKTNQNEYETISFNNKIYPAKAIRSAVEAYSEVAVFSIKKDKDHTQVTISGFQPDRREELIGELCNYALYLVKEV